MARQTFYVTRDVRHPLYRTRMLTAGQPLELDAGAAALFRKLGVGMTDAKPAAKVAKPKTVAPKPTAKKTRKRKAAKKTA